MKQIISISAIFFAIASLLLLSACGGDYAAEDDYVNYEHENEYVYEHVHEHENDISEDFAHPINSTEFFEFAAAQFAALQAIWDADGGDMWGVPLHSPVIIFCSALEVIAANQPDNVWDLERIYVNGVTIYTGHSRMSSPFIFRGPWGGETGIFISYQYVMYDADFFVFAGTKDRTTAALGHINHYVMHARQPALMGVYGGWRPAVYDGIRENILLELDALLLALATDGEERLAAVRDALFIRQARREITGDYVNENLLKLSEGTAVYTQLLTTLSRQDSIMALANWTRDISDDDDLSVAISYGYIGGALYGLVLDAFEIEWRRQIVADTDLGQILKENLDL